MADPKISSVDISRLQECNPNLVEGLKRPELQYKMQEVLKGSDLKWDEKSGEVRTSDEANQIKEIIKQAEMVRGFIEAAAGDNEITLEEAKAFIGSHERLRGISPDAFLNEAKQLVEKRWGVICGNLKQYSLEFPLQNLVDNLNIYNDGVYKEEFEQGRMSFSPIKSAANLSWFYNFPLYGLTPLEPSPIKVWDWNLGREKEIEATYMSGDNLAMKDAYDDHLKRQGAIEFLVQVMNKDIKEKGDKGLAWNAFRKPMDPETEKTTAENILKLVEQTGEMTVTVKRPDGSVDADNPATKSYELKLNGAEVAKILRQQLAFEGLFDVLMTADKKARYNKAIAFAQAERPGLLDSLGGGNSIHRDWDNLITSEVNNFYFARSLLSTVIREGTPEQQKAANDLLYKEMSPAAEGPHASEEGGGSLSQKILWAPLGLISGAVNAVFHANWHPIPYRVMSDEEAMYAPERLIRAGLVMWQGPKVIRGAKAADAWGVAKMEAWRAAGKEATIMQKAGYAGLWTLDKGYGFYTGRPFRWAVNKWFRKGAQAAETTSKIKTGMNIAGRVASLGLAAYAFDDYTMHLDTDRYSGPTLDTTSMAQMMTLDPLPPEKK